MRIANVVRGPRRWVLAAVVTLGLIGLGTGVSLAGTNETEAAKGKKAPQITCVAGLDAAAANGDKALTASSDTFKVGTKLKITNGAKSVNVKVTKKDGGANQKKDAAALAADSDNETLAAGELEDADAAEAADQMADGTDDAATAPETLAKKNNKKKKAKKNGGVNANSVCVKLSKAAFAKIAGANDKDAVKNVKITVQKAKKKGGGKKGAKAGQGGQTT